MNLIPFETNGFWGYQNQYGTVILKPQFLKAKYFNNGFALVCCRRYREREFYLDEDPNSYMGGYIDLWGLIDSNGKMIIESEYEDLRILSVNFAIGVKYAGIGRRWNDWCGNKIFAIHYDSDGGKDLGRFREVTLLDEGYCLMESGKDRSGKDPCHLSYKIFNPLGTEILAFGGGVLLSQFEYGVIKLGTGKSTTFYGQKGEKIFEIQCSIGEVSRNLGGFYLFKQSGRIFSLVLSSVPEIRSIELDSGIELSEVTSVLIATLSRD